MADQLQLSLLKKGDKAWNEWRHENLLDRADLREANLSYADLSGADLERANLSKADLSEADLSWRIDGRT